MEAVGEIEGALDEEVAAELTPGDTVRLRGELLLHPLHQVDSMLRSFMEAAPAFDEQATAKELRKILPLWEAMVGSGKAARILSTSRPMCHRSLASSCLSSDPPCRLR